MNEWPRPFYLYNDAARLETLAALLLILSVLRVDRRVRWHEDGDILGHPALS